MLRTCLRRFSQTIQVNGVQYSIPRQQGGPRAVVGICLDGSSLEYIDAAREAGVMPYLHKLLTEAHERGPMEVAPAHLAVVTAVVPTFTNPNNVSIATGVLPSKHGICGNFFLDPQSGKEIMMDQPSFLRCETLFAAMSKQGTPVTVVTAKDKLRRLLGAGLDHPSISISVEKAAEAASEEEFRRALGTPLSSIMSTEKWPPPGIYDPEISIFALKIGIALIKRQKHSGGLYYLSTTDYVQHKHAPGTPEANSFYRSVDSCLEQLHDLGCVVGLTADHGMNAKVGYNDRPKVVYASKVLEEGGVKARVILPITDPYVVHHGSLGSFACVYLDQHSDLTKAMGLLRMQPGIYTVMNREEAVRNFDLPPDRIGDVVVLGDRDTVLGKSEEFHDLSQIPSLRSHGGMDESVVPMFINRPLRSEYALKLNRGKVRNFHLYDFLLNGVN